MQIGCQMAFSDATDPAYIAAAGQVAEETGFHSLWVPEHVLFFPEYASRYPYAEGGKLPGDPKSLLDPFMALNWVAANTSRIKLGTGICLVPQRNPVYTAKQVADLDYLSEGRVEFGIGIGWLREEFAALGVPWRERAARTIECLQVMQALWCDEVSTYHGKFFDIEGAWQNPKPVQKPHPPLIFGGESDAALQRVASMGQGWYGFNLTPQMLKQRLAKLDDYLIAQNRKREDISIYVSPAREAITHEAMFEFAASGIQQLILPVFGRDVDALRSRAESTMAQTRNIL